MSLILDETLKINTMKKILSYLPFAVVLIVNMLSTIMFALTGDLSMIVLLTLGILVQIIVTQNIIE